MAKQSKKNFFRFMSVDHQKKNWFDLSHTNSGSCNMGHLVPVLCEPTLPNDYFSCNLSYLVRMAQMVAPPMTRIGIHFFPFYVPNRILMNSRDWDKWLADIDNTSGKSLPTLSFSPIYTHIANYVEDTSYVERSLSSLGGDFTFTSTGSYTYTLYFKGTELSMYMTPAEVPGLFDVLKNLSPFDIDDSDEIGGIIINILNDYQEYPFVSTLLDYFGFPVNSPLMSTKGHLTFTVQDEYNLAFSLNAVMTPTRAFQVLPMLAYLYIWNEYFRQEFIQEEIPEDILEDFNDFKQRLDFDPSILWTLKRRDWEHDYFTSCLPAPQLGEQASIEIGTDGKFTIPELREANVIQKIREKLLHGGSRVWEILANFFNSNVSDARIQIPEFIRPLDGTGSSWLRISDIYQTAPGVSDAFPSLTADANIAAPRGASVNTNRVGLRFKHKCPEHGYIIILMNIQPEPVYCQGIPRHFLSLDTLDMGWPDFANITEQPVYAYEVYATPDNSRPSSTGDYPIFGFQSQYAWYKFHNSELHGELRDDLDFFHFGRIFAEQPELNDTFLTCNPTDRPFPIEYEYDKLTYHIAFDLGVDRCLPYYGVPSLR